MATTTVTEYAPSTRPQGDQRQPEPAARRYRPSGRALAVIALGVALLLVFTPMLVSLWVSYRPYRGC